MSEYNNTKHNLKLLPQEQRLELIAEKAKDLFAEQGFSNTTMDMIGKRIGIGRTTLYDYFQSKDDMLYYLIEQRIELDEHIFLDGTVDMKLQQLMVASLTRFKDNYILYQILFTEKPAFTNQTTNKLLQWQHKVLTTVSQVLEQAIETHQLKPRCSVSQMVFMFQALLGQRMSQLLLTEHTSLDAEINLQSEAETLTNLMIHGIGDVT